MRRPNQLLTVLVAGFALATGTLQGQETGAEVLVYKKWIGASGEEADVEAHLRCRDGGDYSPLRVNRGEPGSWWVANVPKDGIFCTVLEVERESFVADMDDCRDLLVLPGRGAECTLVNTKVVKRIEMLNRYGVVIMIAVMLGAGLGAVHRYGRF